MFGIKSKLVYQLHNYDLMIEGYKKYLINVLQTCMAIKNILITVPTSNNTMIRTLMNLSRDVSSIATN